MKNLYIFLLFIFSSIILSCSGSDLYQGNWKVTDSDKNQYEIIFEPKKFTLKNTEGIVTSHTYTQNSVSISNGIKTYGINLDDGRRYHIHFPFPDNPTVGTIQDEYDNIIYVISRDAYITFQDLYEF